MRVFLFVCFIFFSKLVNEGIQNKLRSIIRMEVTINNSEYKLEKWFPKKRQMTRSNSQNLSPLSQQSATGPTFWKLGYSSEIVSALQILEQKGVVYPISSNGLIKATWKMGIAKDQCERDIPSGISRFTAFVLRMLKLSGVHLQSWLLRLSKIVCKQNSH